MNYIKKKINKHKLQNRNHDDDDVYDYIPAVPPHPSELAKQQQQQQHQQPDLNVDSLSEEELKELEERKRSAEAKAREKEEAKKGQEAWKFFEQLNARVSETVTKSQSVIESLKDSTTAEELIKQADLELGFAQPEEEEAPVERGAVFNKGAWVAFAEGESKTRSSETTPQTPSQPAVALPSLSEQPLKPEVVIAEEGGPSIIEELLDDFGFEDPVKVTAETPEICDTDIGGEVDDPFDTSYVSVSLVEPKAAAEIICQSKLDSSTIESESNQTEVYKTPVKVESLQLMSQAAQGQNLDSTGTSEGIAGGEMASESRFTDSTAESDFDPEIADIYLQQQGKKGQIARYGSSTSLASISSNPFLNDDFADGYNPGMPSGAVTPYSGSTTPKRRGSTNPFEDPSPDDEAADGQMVNEASAIAALTADFCSAIGEKEEEKATANQQQQQQPEQQKPQPPLPPPPPTIVEVPPPPPPPPIDNSDEGNVISKSDANEQDTKPFPPPPPPSTEPFDPFATIHDDHNEEIDGASEATTTKVSTAGTTAATVPSIDDTQGNKATLEDEVPVPSVIPNTDQSSFSSGAFEGGPTSANESTGTDIKCLTTKPFDPFEQVDEPTTPCVEEVPPLGQQATESTDHNEFTSAPPEATSTTEYNGNDDDEITNENAFAGEQVDETTATATAEDGVVNKAFEDYTCSSSLNQITAPLDQMEQQESTTTATTTATEQQVNEYLVDSQGFNEQLQSESEMVKDDIKLPDFSDPDVDPFDTSTFSFEPVADAVKITDKSTFDEFSARFEGTSDNTGKVSSIVAGVSDAFSSPLPLRKNQKAKKNKVTSGDGFDSFDPFAKKDESSSSDDDDDDDEVEKFRIVIKAKMRDNTSNSLATPVPLLPPPPKTPTKEIRKRGELDEFDSFLNRKTAKASKPASIVDAPKSPSVQPPSSLSDRSDYVPPVLGEMKRAESTESPSTPLYDEDISQPLEEYPSKYSGDGWEMYIRYPAKKKFTGNRFWKKIFVRMSENNVIQLFNKRDDADPFQELPLQPSYSLSEISAQQFDQFGKIFTIKLQYVFYRERVGVRKGQIAKVIQGQITSFGSIAKLGMPLDHAPQVSELIKLGTHEYNDIRELTQVVEEALFRMPLHRDRALSYKTEEIQITVQDDYYVEQNRQGTILKQLARVQVFFLAFLNGMPGVEIGLNDLTRQGKEVVGRHDIIPVVTEEWIRLESYEFHSCVMIDEFEKTRTIKLIPPDACYFELMRFRVRPPKNRELPLQVTCNLYVTKRKVELRCEVLVPGAISRKHGQIPCEDISIRIHIPECWIYFFRTEKHMRYGSVKSAARRPGKIKVSSFSLPCELQFNFN